MIGKLYVTAYKEQCTLVDYSSLGLLSRKFTITHLSVVAIITVTHVHEENSRVSQLRVLQNSRILRKLMPRKRAET